MAPHLDDVVAVVCSQLNVRIDPRLVDREVIELSEYKTDLVAVEQAD